MSEDGAWVRVESSGRTNVASIVATAMVSMPEPLRARWVAAMNANQFDMRILEPNPDLDPADPTIAEERFAFLYQLYLTDSDDPDEFSSIQWPVTELGHYVDAEE
jgi:hypothetical protein